MATRTRRSGLDRTCEYFETVSAREAEAAFMLVSKIMQERTGKRKLRKPDPATTEAAGDLMTRIDTLDVSDEESPIAAARAKRAAAS